jgi:hypothetical protein
MGRTHTITAEIEVHFRICDMPMDEHETEYLEIEIEYSFTPGCPEQGPSYASGGEPASPDEIGFISAKLVDGKGLSPTQEQVNEWAEAWIYDDGYDKAVENASSDNEPDWDAVRDAQRDDELTRGR